jgi:SOS-response transcriptional repressor LexA
MQAVDFSSWLRGFMQREGLTQTELGRLVGVCQSTVSSWLQGAKRPRGAAVLRLAQLSGCSTSEVRRLVGWGDGTPPISRPTSLRRRAQEARRLLDELPLEVQVYDTLPVHAGSGGVPLDVVYLPPCAGPAAPRRVVGLTVHGDCMEPAISAGDVVVVDLEETVLDGDVVAVEIDGEWLLRRCWVEASGCRLTCDNAAGGPDAEAPQPAGAAYVVVDVRRGRPRRRRA